MAYNLYPKIAPIVREECKKAKVPYASYHHVHEMIAAFVDFMKHVGAEP